MSRGRLMYRLRCRVGREAAGEEQMLGRHRVGSRLPLGPPRGTAGRALGALPLTVSPTGYGGVWPCEYCVVVLTQTRRLNALLAEECLAGNTQSY